MVYSKIKKKIVIKRIKTKCEEKKNWRGCYEILRWGTIFREKKEKKNSIQHQTRDASDTRHTIM